ncbi:FeoB-associated Cys-rich membrane protein [Megalodesulfovibrio paquesii]
METVIVLFIVATAAVYVFRKFAKPLTGKGGGCGCGNSSCGASRPTFKQGGKVVELRPHQSGGCSCGAGCTCDEPPAPGDDSPTTRLQ